MRDVEIPNWLKELPLAPVFHPTDTEFADPIAYISKIEKEASAFGICKVIPPLPKPSRRYVIANLNKSLLKCPELGNDVKLNNVEKGDGDVQAVFTTRHQELGHNSGKRTKEVNKQVWQSGEIYTLDQFESKSKIFARSQLGMVKETPPLSVESLFWKASCEKPIYIEYANDVPGSGFGEPVGTSRFVHKHGRRRRRTFRRNDKDCYKTNNCDDPKGESVRCSPSSSVDMLKKDVNSLNMLSDRVPRQRGSSSNGGQEIEGSSSWKLSNCPWNLQVIARSPGSLTRFMPDDIPGVTSPMVYIGMLFSWFAWHVEDHELHSLNFLHMGSPKTWYAVPGDYAFTFEEVIRSKAYGGGIDRLAALTLLGEKTTLLSPETVVASGIPCCRLVQNPGEFVVTFPRAYHIGFSHGFNCGEAANFGTPKWLSVAKEAAVRRAAMNFLPMLSHQHLLYLLTMSFIPRVPRSLLPGIRTSRLKNRQKEERELLVKKEFLEDILKENKLLTSILQKNTSYRAVIWDIESLSPSIIKESDSSNITPDNTKKVHVENNNSLDSFDQMSQEMETLLHMEEDDMSSDFQIDSGTLPCVTCGVLGYPFMSVIQPSVYMFMDNINNIIPMKDRNVIQDLGIQNYSNSMDEDSLSDELDRSLEASKDSSKANICNGWNTSNGYLRPRIFCLEHASLIEELLVSKGGAKLLIICHSDFQKIKIQAAAIAEQIGSAFIYNDIQLGNANREDLDLINLAIDNEQEDESLEDWTLKLNINLRQSIKLKDKLSPDKINHALPLDALFSDTTPASSAVSLQWQATKTRSNRKLNRSIKESSKSELKEKLSEAQMPKKEAILIQYSRRNFKFKSKPQDFVTNLGKNLSERVSSVVKNHEKLVGENSLGTVSCATSIENSGTEKDGGNGEKMDVQNEASDVLTENDSGLMQEGLELAEPGGAGADEPVADLNIGNDENTPGSSCFTSRNGSDEPVTDLDIGNDENTPGLGCFTSRNGSKRADEPVTDLEIGNDENNPGPSFASRNESNSGNEPVTALNPGNDENTPGSSSRNESKRKREAELSDFDGFIRSPCEGLRPRSRKDSHKNTISITIPEKSTKKTKTSVKIREKDENGSHGSHRCDQEGCKLSFRTKTELSLHKKNRCPHEGCGKKFSSHRYAVLHLRVHDDDRPLKCTWKGCKMTFKWAWARTEHLRVHTGERPYKCNVEGCDRTFRFVSDYSRHRRKTGHNVHVKE